MFSYLTNCVAANGADIADMVDQAVPVSLATIRRRCADFNGFLRLLGYAVGRERGLHIARDWSVRYYRSIYRGTPCYFVDWSAIEYIFVENERT